MRLLMKKCCFFYFIYVICFFFIPAAGVTADGSFTFKSYYPSSSSFNYRNLYLYYRLFSVPSENVTVNVSLVKGTGESGYYPGGYLTDSETGLYENGSYYVLFKDRFKMNRIVLGNYYPKFGQGILYGGTFPIILSNPYYDLARYRDGIYPASSSSKTVVLEGIALEYERCLFKLRPFLSVNRFDCTAGESSYYQYNDNDSDGIINEDDNDDFTGKEDGFPDTYSCKNNIFSAVRDYPDYEVDSDRDKRNNLSEFVSGLNFSSKTELFTAGFTVSFSHYNRLIDPYYNFDAGEDDKTSFYFRGKQYWSANTYFKLYQPLEIFGEIAGTFYRSLSYYEEFNGDFVSAVGFSGGVRKKIHNTGVILWTQYLPATLVNPHGQEYPEGINNITGVLAGVQYGKDSRRFAHWLYTYSELSSTEYSGDLETGLSYAQRIDVPLTDSLDIRLKQTVEIIDHYYYAPDSLSWKLLSKFSLRHALADRLSMQYALENRFGGPFETRAYTGTGVSSALLYRDKRQSSSAELIYYNTDSSRFASLYPYERPLDGWSFIPEALNGTGLAGSFVFMRDFLPNFSAGTKLRYTFDFLDMDDRDITMYIMNRYSF